MSAARLSAHEKTAIVEAYAAGEPIKVIAARFGVHQSYPGLLARRRAAAQIGRAVADLRKEANR